MTNNLDSHHTHQLFCIFSFKEVIVFKARGPLPTVLEWGSQCWGQSTPHTNKQFSDASRVAKNSTQCWYNLIEEIIRVHRLKVQSCKTASPFTHTHTGYQLQAQVWTFWPTGYIVEIPTTRSLCFVNLLNASQNSGKPFYSLDYQFVTKDL